MDLDSVQMWLQSQSGVSRKAIRRKAAATSGSDRVSRVFVRETEGAVIRMASTAKRHKRSTQPRLTACRFRARICVPGAQPVGPCRRGACSPAAIPIVAELHSEGNCSCCAEPKILLAAGRFLAVIHLCGGGGILRNHGYKTPIKFEK